MGQVIRLFPVPTSIKVDVDEFKKLLNIALKGDQKESDEASRKLLNEYRVRVVRPSEVRSFSIH